jgi:hypothetical protein
MGAILALVPTLLPLIGGLLDRFIPDPAAAAKAKAEAFALITQTAANADSEQLKVDAVEAASTSIFVAGWRPFIGWVCGGAFAIQFVAEPLISYTAAALGHPVPMPPGLDPHIWELITGMLGMGALRSFDKLQAPKK